MRILFLVPYPTEGASNRVRVEQFIPYLNSKGIATKVRPFVNKQFYKILYKKGVYLKKIFWFLICTANRKIDIFRAFFYDVVFIHRETYPFFGPVIESMLHWMGKPLVFDFDDAIFLPNTSKENRYIDRLKNPDKIIGIIKMSRLVIAGNLYLKNFASQYNGNVIVIPSSLDTDHYRPAERKKAKIGITIGWIGSVTTQEFLADIEDALAVISARYKGIVIKIVGGEFQSRKLTNIINKKWSLADEVDDIQSFDIGIMPMPDNEWTRGKCGFKAILYMACGIPVVASSVGVNSEIVDDGVNGFLVKTRDEWVEKLSLLIDDYKLRETMGQKGRQKVLGEYSLSLTAPLLYEQLLAVYPEAKG